jgi:hypothetical protein
MAASNKNLNGRNCRRIYIWLHDILTNAANYGDGVLMYEN